MAEHYRGITDRWGRRIEKRVLTEAIAAPTLTGVRTPYTGYPGDGLTPTRLAAILREADGGDPLRYLELAETIEERDLHYAGVLGTRKRSVSQLDIVVDAAGEESGDIERADMVRDWLERDELSDELFEMLDAIGKGYSFTEIIWDTSSGQWRPERLEWRDPRWFRFDRTDGLSPLLLDAHGQETPLPAFKFVRAVMRAKSGLPVRSGIARIAAWAWMFKAYTQRDWAIFCQNFGQPVRLGKYGPGATADDRDTLYRAVANIAGDCAAIIPESMTIEFVEGKAVTGNNTMFKDRADWLDQQISKGVLGQTATTDAIAGGHAVGREHRQVQEDIERSDARQLSAIINRDLVQPWMMLEYGPGVAAPRVRIGRQEEKDVKQTVDAVARLVPMGLRVGQKQMRDLFGLDEPEEDDELLAPAQTRSPEGSGTDDDPEIEPGPDEDPDKVPVRKAQKEALAARNAPSATITDPATLIERRAVAAAAGGVSGLVEAARQLADRASSLEELQAMLEIAIETGEIEGDLADLAEVMRGAMLAAELSGRLAAARAGNG